MLWQYTKRDAVKNFFPLPNEIFSLGLSSSTLAVYSYLLYCEDRKTYQCYPSCHSIGKAVHMSVNTVRKYVAELEGRGLIISVSKQYVRNPSGEVMLSRPKTETSVRQVSIPQDAVDLLIQEHGKHPDNQYMFPSPVTGEMYHPDSIVKLHEKILKDAGLEHIRFHDLRHTFATLALQNGVDVKTVSSMLGHYDAGFTLRTYTHATRQMQNQAAETMGNFMAKVM